MSEHIVRETGFPGTLKQEIVQELVRCGECKWYDPQTRDCHNPRFGDGWGNYPPPDVNEIFFCADGERRRK